MSTTVKYKGSTLATVSNQTKTLLTSGTWLEDDIELTDVTSGGGATNVVQGTFTGTTANSTLTLTLPYTGNGYPVSITIYLSDGMGGSGIFPTTIQRYAIGIYWILKRQISTPPTYEGGGAADNATVLSRYKSSTSSATTYTTSSSESVYPYGGAVGAGATGAVEIVSATQIQVKIAPTNNYGFLANQEYTYNIVYSS